MGQLHSNLLSIVDQGDGASIVYTNKDGSTKKILFNYDGIYINGVLASADAVGAALTPVVRTYSPTIAANSVNANLTAVDTAIGVDNTPVVRTNNPTVANTAINVKVQALDAAIGVTPTSTNVIAAANSVNVNLSALDTSVNNSITTVAAAGSAQNDGPIGIYGVVVVTAANATKAVTLPVVSATKYVLIYNATANQDLVVFPATGQYINAAAQDASVKFKHATLVSCVLCTYASAAHWTMTAIQATIS
jgi:hypothetical protein